MLGVPPRKNCEKDCFVQWSRVLPGKHTGRQVFFIDIDIDIIPHILKTLMSLITPITFVEKHDMAERKWKERHVLLSFPL